MQRTNPLQNRSRVLDPRLLRTLKSKLIRLEHEREMRGRDRRVLCVCVCGVLSLESLLHSDDGAWEMVRSLLQVVKCARG